MTDKEVLLSHARDLKLTCENNSMITSTAFLTLEQLSNIQVLEKEINKTVDTFYYGGGKNAERKIAVFVPSFFEVDDIFLFFKENRDLNPLGMISIHKDKFSHLSHRDYLGSLMGLGIEREMVGDIILCETGAHIYCLKKMENFICNNMKKAGRGSVSCENVDISEYITSVDNSVEIRISVSSLRLDNIISAAFNLSRSKADEYIRQGLAYVNDMQVLKRDFLLSIGDKVVLRTKGKTIINKIAGETKKGRLHIIIKKFM